MFAFNHAMSPNPIKRDVVDPTKLLILIVFTIFGVELILMVIFTYFIHWQQWVEVVLDASLLILFLFPLLYRFVYRPLIREIDIVHKTEEQLHLQSTALEVVENTVFVTDAEGTIQWVNPAFTRLTGYLGEEAIGKTPRILNSGKQTPQYYQELWHTILSGVPWHSEVVDKRKDGSLFTADQTITPVKDAAGKVTNFVAIQNDISERITAEEKLRASEAKYSTLVEKGNDGILILQDNGIFKYVNSVMCKITGYTSEEIIGQPFKNYLSPEYQKIEIERYQKRVQGQHIPSRYEIEILSKGGIRTPVEISASEIEYEGKPAVMAIVRDITERKKVEDTLKQINSELVDSKHAVENVVEDFRLEKAKAEAMLVSIGEGLVAVDTDGKVILMNGVAEQLLRWNHLEAIGKQYDSVISLGDEKGSYVPLQDRPLTKALKSQSHDTTFTNNLYILSKNQFRFPVAITVSPVLFDTGVIGAIEVFRDITHEKDIDKAKTEFVSLASHQLRTPLTTIGWYTEMLLKGDVGAVNDKQHQYLDEIYGGNKRMVELVNSLLNVSRIETGLFGIEPEDVKVKDVVDGVLKDLTADIQGKQLQINTSFNDIVTVTADPKLLRLVFQNVLSNAVQYTAKAGLIDIHASRTPTEIQFTIRDTGIGIPKASQDKIFTKLYRADNAKDVQPEGNGLGLYMVKGILNHAGGRIWFESEEGKGSTFYVTIPVTGMQTKTSTISLA